MKLAKYILIIFMIITLLEISISNLNGIIIMLIYDLVMLFIYLFERYKYQKKR